MVINEHFLLSENYFLSKKEIPPRLSNQVCGSMTWLMRKKLRVVTPVYMTYLPNPPPATISTKAENYDQNVPQT